MRALVSCTRAVGGKEQEVSKFVAAVRSKIVRSRAVDERCYVGPSLVCTHKCTLYVIKGFD